MKFARFCFALTIAVLIHPLVLASQADDTVITINGQTPGVTPFISQLNLTVSEPGNLQSIQFAIAPKPGSVTRPLSGTYSNDYLISRGLEIPPSQTVFVPVYGLYDDYPNSVTLTYTFLDGSSKQDMVTITTTAFSDPCGYKNPTVLQARTTSTSLSYDYFMIRENCGLFAPTIMDTDGAIRWVGPAGDQPPFAAEFFDNAIYRTQGTSLYRIELDGTTTLLHDYSDIDVTDFHHNIDRGKVGIILDVDTTSQFESTNIEVDSAGNVLKVWSLADIISAAMTAGGDDPSQFVYPAPMDWFHNNAVTYKRADDSIIISSRENFVICLDYETSTIKWILGDQTKKWYQFPSLRSFALTTDSNTLPPVGQHAPSITYDLGLTVFDNGFNSALQVPPGVLRNYASPRKYQLNLGANSATEVWNDEMGQSINSPICGSVYEDAPLNYLVDYAFVGGFGASAQYAQLLGLDSAGEKIFYYQYPTAFCNTAFNSIPLHLESASFPTVEPRALNLSTRGVVGIGDNSLIGGFIISGTESQTVVLRALGPSLVNSGLSGTVADPVLTLYDSTGVAIATNDDWQTDPGAAQITADGLAPSDPAEAATIQTLAPDSYTFVVTGKDSTTGLGLVEAYDLSPLAASKLANLSTRGFVGTGDNVLISGFIVGEVASNTLAIRALGPSLASAGISDPLSDPMLTVYDRNGVAIASNDNWQDDISASELEKNGLAPTNAAESATILQLPAGAYTAIATGTGGTTGVGLVELFDL